MFGLDPCDGIESFNDLRKWVNNSAFDGILLCMWTGGVPGIARDDEPWRAGLGYLSKAELNRRLFNKNWKKQESG